MKTNIPLKQLPCWLALSRLNGMGPARFNKITQRFPDLQQFFKLTTNQYHALRLSDLIVDQIKQLNWDNIQREIQWLTQSEIHLLTQADSQYPALLAAIQGAPALLYVQGNVALLHKPQIAIVGSRRPTAAGRELAQQFARGLSEAGWVVTSGMALGIDGAAHRGALQVSQETIAVQGTGLKQLYPNSHHPLAMQILEKGALVSEYPIETPPSKRRFPERNRIISGLCLGVLVVEAAMRSGSLITAYHALDQGREVFAIPGSVHNPMVRGCHLLISEGAKLVETVDDILAEVEPLLAHVAEPNAHGVLSKTPTGMPLAPIVQALLEQIDYALTPFDVIVARTQLPVSDVTGMLLELEMSNYIVRECGGYQRISEI